MSDKEDERQQDLVYHAASRLDDRDTKSRIKFPEVRGLCRTCSRSMIRRRQYSEVPQVICQVNYEQAHQVPLDIMECSDYRRQGEMDIRTMQDLAIIIDSRARGGQCLLRSR